MARVVVRFGDNFVNIPADEFHEDEGYIKIYSEHNELVGIFKTSFIDCAYRTEKEAAK